MFIEIIGDYASLESLDRDDVEDLLEQVLGSDGEVTGAGSGGGRWHLDVEIAAGTDVAPLVLQRMAAALTETGLGWVRLRIEGEDHGESAADVAG